jgi:c(7)-type cytochrome triheme protein
VKRALWMLLAAAALSGALAVPSLARLGDVKFSRKDSVAMEIPPAIFPHLPHWIKFKCYVCHDAIFKMKAGADKVTMDAISDGKFCGACHNGKTAFPANFSTCDRCHHT